MGAVDLARKSRMRRIRDATQALTRAVDLESVFGILHRELFEALHPDTFFLALYDETSRTVQVVRQVEFDTLLPGGTFPLGQGPTSGVIRSRASRLIRCWSREAPRVQVQYVSATPGLPESAAIAPLVADDHVLGVIATHSYRPNAFDEDDLHLLEAIAAASAAALASLRRSEHLSAQLCERVSELEAIVGTVADALLIVDGDGRIVGLNHAARELLSAGDSSIVLGQSLERQVWGLWPLGAPEITETLAPMLQALRRGETPAEVEVRLERPSRRVLSFTGTPLVDVHGTIKGCVLIVRDTTGRHDVEALKEEMLAVASHDLKTPVAVIRSEAQLLRRAMRQNAATMDGIYDGLGSIVHQTERLTTLLALLLDLSRIEAGRFDIRRSMVDLGDLASAAAAEMQPTTEQHRLEVHVHGRATGYWDADRLQQVLTNLLTNAVKYSPEGGLIQVEVVGAKDSVSVCVRDHGVGLAPDEARHVFERFFRAEPMRRLEGAGLGLYICHSILAAHGGRIWVESAGPGQGCSFCFVLPRGEPS